VLAAVVPVTIVGGERRMIRSDNNEPEKILSEINEAHKQAIKEIVVIPHPPPSDIQKARTSEDWIVQINKDVIGARVPLPGERRPQKILTIRFQCQPVYEEDHNWEVREAFDDNGDPFDPRIYTLNTFKSLDEQIFPRLTEALRGELNELNDPEMAYTIFVELYEGKQLIGEAFEFIRPSA